VLIDTAGIRKKRRLADSVEFFSVQRAEESIRRADLVVFLLDAEAGITEQDKKIGDLITEANKACVVAVNKWDLFEEAVRQKAREQVSTRRKGVPESPLKIFGEWVKEKLFFLDYAPVIFISATAGLHLDRLLEAVRYVAAQMEQKIPTSVLNRVLHEAIERRQPISAAGHFLNFYYATQTNQAPPTFLLFVNRKELIAPQYAKYLCDAMRRAFGYEGCPIVLEARPRPKTVESVRQRGPKRK
jgi:GTP-binding protein